MVWLLLIMKSRLTKVFNRSGTILATLDRCQEIELVYSMQMVRRHAHLEQMKDYSLEGKKGVIKTKRLMLSKII